MTQQPVSIVQYQFPPIPGVTLIHQLNARLFDEYRDPTDPEVLQDVSGIEFVVDATGHPYYSILDFQMRADEYAESGNLGALTLIWPDDVPRYTNTDVIRALRTLETSGDFVEIGTDSILVKKCISDVLMAQHTRIEALEEQLASKLTSAAEQALKRVSGEVALGTRVDIHANASLHTVELVIHPEPTTLSLVLDTDEPDHASTIEEMIRTYAKQRDAGQSPLPTR